MLRSLVKIPNTRFLATASKSVETTDVLIVGGGPAGLSLAAAIKTSPHLSHLSTTLIEAGSLTKIRDFYDNPPQNYQNRIISLTNQAKVFLENKLAIEFLKDRIQPFDGLYVTDGCSKGTMEMERENMGYMVEIHHIQSAILKRIKEVSPAGLDILDSTKVTNIEYSVPGDLLSWPLVTLDNGKYIRTRLLVGADGKNSPVKNFSGLKSRGWSYNSWGIVANLKLVYPPFKLRGWQRFLKTGPIALLPMPNDDAFLTWSTTEPLSRLLLSIDPKATAALINASFVLEEVDLKYYYQELEQGTITTEELIRDIEFRIQQVFDQLADESEIDRCYPPKVADVVGPSRGRFPLSLAHVDTYIAERIALIGDAAHTIHPLAGQGLNMGQADCESLVKSLETATQRGLDIGSKLALEPYWSERYPLNSALIGGVDKLQKLYSTDFKPIVAVRSFGMNLVNQMGPLKEFIMDQISGISK
ncbi:putative N,N-dimethylaniline monooxygenase COQ6 Ecym_1120 [Eremothecium cymbalariae DBVPG|uniref:Ubiquinone biosynthesis monooxygenase COQ6, mitochondrial n=1 Tax=Eremothecium cymbalariae (strain CBS 270.75 / DBVPG 7215 / KCTC 17166 / NRRL Y-17582) TaxID=931890 RepID=G8JML9_ERECY|nr:hypothetical protein Ecym_1120 [Eremothecium cymbalariae DBVPG\